MEDLAPGLTCIDSLLGGIPRITATFLVHGPQPAVVDVGAQTSAGTMRAALTELGIGPDDLAWIVLTHIHLDHCGGTGDLARAFPRARVVVHGRGVRHLIDPERLIAGSHAVYGERAPLYGDLLPVAAERIDEAPDGHRVPVGPGRELVMIETPGHARHHMSVLDEATGSIMAGDALGVRLGEGGLYPMLPPSEVDLEAGDASLGRLEEVGAERLAVAHFDRVPEVGEAIATAREQLRRAGEAVLPAYRADPDRDAVAEALFGALPFDRLVTDPAARERWATLGWLDTNVDGLMGWAARRTKAE